jgi:hypothetical protein
VADRFIAKGRKGEPQTDGKIPSKKQIQGGIPMVRNGARTLLESTGRGILRRCALGALILACCGMSLAQSLVLDLPRQSQHALVSQRIGITDVTINYHRPLTGGRKVWGGLVPYGDVWRAGANENTTIAFTDPVTIEGKTLDRGTYGLHMIPNGTSGP